MYKGKVSFVIIEGLEEFDSINRILVRQIANLILQFILDLHKVQEIRISVLASWQALVYSETWLARMIALLRTAVVA